MTLHPGQCSVRIFVPLEFLCQLPFGATFLTAFIHGTVEPIFSTPGLVRFDRLETQRYDMGHQVRVPWLMLRDGVTSCVCFVSWASETTSSK